MITVGLDLHNRYITACALDDSGTVRAEHPRLESRLDALGRWLGGLSHPVLVAMEATLYWHWLERPLTARSFAVMVAHPCQIKLIWQARTKSDPIDARKLAVRQHGRPRSASRRECQQGHGGAACHLRPSLPLTEELRKPGA